MCLSPVVEVELLEIRVAQKCEAGKEGGVGNSGPRADSGPDLGGGLRGGGMQSVSHPLYIRGPPSTAGDPPAVHHRLIKVWSRRCGAPPAADLLEARSLIRVPEGIPGVEDSHGAWGGMRAATRRRGEAV